MMQLGLEQSLQAYPKSQSLGKRKMVMRVSEAAFKLKPDLVVMDILPRLDGIAATQRIRQNCQTFVWWC